MLILFSNFDGWLTLGLAGGFKSWFFASNVAGAYNVVVGTARGLFWGVYVKEGSPAN